MKYAAFIETKDAGSSDCYGRWFDFPLEEEWIRAELEMPDNQLYEIRDWTLPEDLPAGLQIEEANLIYERIKK